jgi:predicted ATPase
VLIANGAWLAQSSYNRAMIHLRSARLNPPASANGFPFNVPAFQSFDELTFASPVTIFVGENGSGKSTLLEALAIAIGSITVGSADAAHDESLNPVRDFASALRLTWSKRTRKGFFLRSEDFFGYARRMAQMRQEAARDLKDVDEDYADRSEYARLLARLPHQNQMAAIDRRYGEGLDSVSHGESFFTLFQSRFVADGLYLLDEPEAPLSPMRQLTLLSMMRMMVEEQNAQFVIATHSPILMAYPDAAILSFDGGAIQPAEYETLEHVTITRSFLTDPAQFLRHL